MKFDESEKGQTEHKGRTFTMKVRRQIKEP